MEVEQLKLLKGRFDPENVGGTKERTGSWLIRHTVSDRFQTFLSSRRECCD
jgi:hypothetical protein